MYCSYDRFVKSDLLVKDEDAANSPSYSDGDIDFGDALEDLQDTEKLYSLFGVKEEKRMSAPPPISSRENNYKISPTATNKVGSHWQVSAGPIVRTASI